MKAWMLKKWDIKPVLRPGSPEPEKKAPDPVRPDPARSRDILSLGPSPWKPELLRASLTEFLALFRDCPHVDPASGIQSPDAFALWFMVRSLSPSAIIESGVDKGVSTWVLERSAPTADLLCLCPDLARRVYISQRARYLDEDFLDSEAFVPASGHDSDPGLVVAVFNDHMDVFPRVQRCAALGIKRLLFHGNYPEHSGQRHISLAACLNSRNAAGDPGFRAERQYLLERTETYFIFPPIFDHAAPVTLEKSFITGEALCGQFRPDRHAGLERFRDEMSSYRWTSLLKLK
jgi:hypothetical protein